MTLPLCVPQNQLVLVVDLDGTLVQSDMLHEYCLKFLGISPLTVLKIPFWLLAGKAVLKRQLSARLTIEPSVLPYNEELICWLRQQRYEGRRLVLCTASDQGVAEAIAH